MSELTEFLLARIAEEEVWIERGRALGGGAVLWEEETIVQATRECGAKRQIIAMHDGGTRRTLGRVVMRKGCSCGSLPPCPTLIALAAVYADHPDFDEAWRSTSEI